MKKIQDNILSLVAIVLSTIAINLSLRFEAFTFTESALNWTLGIIVAIVGIAVSVALVTQIWTAINIAPMIDKKMKLLKAEMEFTSHSLHVESIYHLNAYQAKGNAHKFFEMNIYNMGLYSFILAIKSLSNCKEKNYCKSEIESLIKLIKEWKSDKVRVALNSKDKERLIEELDIPNIQSGKLISEILNLPTNDKLPVINETPEYYANICKGCSYHS